MCPKTNKLVPQGNAPHRPYYTLLTISERQPDTRPGLQELPRPRLVSLSATLHPHPPFQGDLVIPELWGGRGGRGWLLWSAASLSLPAARSQGRRGREDLGRPGCQRRQLSSSNNRPMLTCPSSASSHRIPYGSSPPFLITGWKFFPEGSQHGERL